MDQFGVDAVRRDEEVGYFNNPFSISSQQQNELAEQTNQDLLPTIKPNSNTDYA